VSRTVTLRGHNGGQRVINPHIVSVRFLFAGCPTSRRLCRMWKIETDKLKTKNEEQKAIRMAFQLVL
jgi:hypothetical protein